MRKPVHKFRAHLNVTEILNLLFFCIGFTIADAVEDAMDTVVDNIEEALDGSDQYHLC